MTESDPRSLIRAICFDWAGTTVDFGCCGPVEVFATAFRDEGLAVSEPEIRAPMGMGKRDHIRTMLGLRMVAERWQAVHGRPAQDEDVDRIYNRFLPLQVELVRNHATPIEGVPRMMSELAARGIRVGATTGYAREVMAVLEPLAARAGYAPSVTITVDEVDRGRPAPDQLLAALRSLGGIRPEHAIAVDDTSAGIRAGRTAGMWTVGVAASGNLVGLDRDTFDALKPRERERVTALAREKLFAAGAHAVVDVVTEVPPMIDRFNQLLSEGRTPDTVQP